MSEDDRNMRILICIGGGPEAFTGLKFAHRLSQHSCADIALLYVRPQDSGLKSGGMEVRVARENILDWGLELPGMAHLRKARDILADLGEIEQATDEWVHRELSGDPAGEFIREYYTECGSIFSLRLRTSSDVTSAVVDEAKRFKADFIIVGGSPEPKAGLKKFLSRRPLALSIAAHAPCSVIVARHLEPGHGHLVCVDDSDTTRAMLPEALRLAQACNCPISLISVAESEDKLDSAKKAVGEAAELFRAGGIEPHEVLTEVGNPARILPEIGYDFSLIVMGESEKPWFAKGFSVVHSVADQARNSVMIIK